MRQGTATPGVQNRTPCNTAPLVPVARDPQRLVAAASVVAARVESITRARGGTSCVFIRQGWCYVIHTDSPRAEAWIKHAPGELVGSYTHKADEVDILVDLVTTLDSRADKLAMLEVGVQKCP